MARGNFLGRAISYVMSEGLTNIPAFRKFAFRKSNAIQEISSKDNNFHWGDYLGTRFAQLQIVHALCEGDRQRASKMLLSLCDTIDSLSAEDFSCVLQYCAQTPDPLFALETWKLMEEKAIFINKSTCRFIIQAFSKGGYLREAFSWLNFIGQSDGGSATVLMFNIFLSGCRYSHRLDYARYCLELMESQHVGKSEVTYCHLLKLAVLQKKLTTVHEIWKDYTWHYSPSIISLRKFIWSFTKLGDLESAHTALKHMLVLARQGSDSISVSKKGRYHSSTLDIPIPINKINEKTFCLNNSGLSSSLFEKNSEKSEGDLMIYGIDTLRREQQSTHNVLRNLKLDKAEGNQSQHNTTNILLSDTIGSKFLCEEVKTLEVLTNFDKSVGYKMTSFRLVNLLRWSFNNLIHACAQSNNFQLAEHLFVQMSKMGLEPSKHTYDGFVKAAINGKGVAYGMKVLRTMQNLKIEPYDDTFAALSVGHSKNLELDMAETFCDKITNNLPKYIHTFNALLSACNLMDEPERAIRILAKLRHLNIKPNIGTYELLFTLFGTVNFPYEKGNNLSHANVAKRIKLIEMDMMKNGIRHNYTSMKNLMRALGAEGMIQEMLQYLVVAENMLCQADAWQKTDLYTIVLHALVEAKETQKAIEFFKSMRSSGLPATAAIYNIVIECLTCFKSGCALVSLMLRDGFCPQMVTFTALVKVLLASEDFEGALNLLDQSNFEGIHPDIQLFNTVLREAYFKGRVDIIEFIVETIHRKNIQPDPSTLWYTFSAYVECGLHSTALEALQVLSMRMISEEDEILQQNRAKFEEFIISESPDVELQIVEIFQESQEFLATALMNLRWCAIVGSSITWYPDESQWAKRLSFSYDAS